jgi:hypothetical protein
MSRFYALLSIVFMMSFVIVFDKAHFERRNAPFWKTGLLSRQDVDRLVRVLSACQEG